MFNVVFRQWYRVHHREKQTHASTRENWVMLVKLCVLTQVVNDCGDFIELKSWLSREVEKALGEAVFNLID